MLRQWLGFPLVLFCSQPGGGSINKRVSTLTSGYSPFDWIIPGKPSRALKGESFSVCPRTGEALALLRPRQNTSYFLRPVENRMAAVWRPSGLWHRLVPVRISNGKSMTGGS